LLKAEDAVEPENINWENLEISDLEYKLRKILMTIIIYFIIFLSFTLVMYTSAFSKKGTYNCEFAVIYDDPPPDD